MAAAVVIASAGIGAAAGHSYWRSTASQSAPPAAAGPATTPDNTVPLPTNPDGSSGIQPGDVLPGNGSAGTGAGGTGGTGTGGTGGTGPSSGLNSAAGPTDAAAIASRVDAGIVDINTVINYGQGQAAGTGMVLTANGLVLTNNHVISGATTISVTDVGNGKTYKATVVGYDRSHDIAVLQLTNASGLTVVTTSSAPVQIGEGVVAIGNAGGKGGTPSYAGGVITAVNQQITASDASNGTSETLTGLIQTNANVQAGDSGGPLVNVKGEVVGIDTAAGSAYRFSNDTNGFAVPITQALAIASDIEAGKASATVHIGTTAMLGVQIASAQGYGVQGAAVAGVLSNGPAAKAGLQSGDVITAIGGTAVDTPEALTATLFTHKPGDSVVVHYLDSAGQSHSATVKLAEGPPQ
jgi:S1-C subfamily serine protease